jgi:Signal peptidase, peptidase S26
MAVEGYFVFGDNRTMSCNSRRWGVVPDDIAECLRRDSPRSVYADHSAESGLNDR